VPVNKLTFKSCAKVNLYLRVLSRRKDGFHNIETLFERIDLCDKVTLKVLADKKIEIICKHPDVPRNETNLAYRAAKLLQDRFCRDSGVEIKIDKRIPVAAGLGGGSSNAATVLLGLNKLWGLRISRVRLAELAKKVGSDVAFFIYDTKFALGLGRGERIKPLRQLNKVLLWHILAVPRFKVSTPLIYRGWDRLKSKSNKLVRGLTLPKYDVKMFNASHALFNSLEAVTLRLYPQVLRVRNMLLQQGLKAVLMSGSGPAVFGLTSSRKVAAGLAGKLRSRLKSWQIFITKTV